MENRLESGTSGYNIGRLVLAILLLGFVGIILYKYYYKNKGSYTSVPREFQINYLPADFQMDLDEETTLAILSNPYRYRREFNQLIYDLNTAILNHVATRMNVSDSLKVRIRQEYEKHHPYLRNLYFQDFVAMKDTSSVTYQSWYDNESANAVEVLYEVASKYTCFLVNDIMTTVLPVRDGKLYAKGMNVDTPCGLALTEALKPMMKRLEESAAVEDFGRSRGLLQERVEKVISELATVEVRDKKGLSKQMQTKLFGVAVSSTEVEVVAISILKMGFNLNEYFDISLNSRAGLVTVTLPEPTILSHEVFPKFDKLDIGWLREVKDVDLNKSFNLLREEFRRDALQSDLREKAKVNATELMNTMLMPLVSSINRNYELKVQFRATPGGEEFPDPEWQETDGLERVRN